MSEREELLKLADALQRHIDKLAPMHDETLLRRCVAALRVQPAPAASEPVAWTNQAQLEYLKDPEYAEIPMAMWGKRSDRYAEIALYAAPPQAAPNEPGVTASGFLHNLVDWVWLHATEGQHWPSTATAQKLIGLARTKPATQVEADAMKAAAARCDCGRSRGQCPECNQPAPAEREDK